MEHMTCKKRSRDVHKVGVQYNGQYLLPHNSCIPPNLMKIDKMPIFLGHLTYIGECMCLLTVSSLAHRFKMMNIAEGKCVQKN